MLVDGSCSSPGLYLLVCNGVVLWNTYGDCENIAVMKGHAGAIMDLHFSTDGRSSSYDISQMEGHF